MRLEQELKLKQDYDNYSSQCVLRNLQPVDFKQFSKNDRRFYHYTDFCNSTGVKPASQQTYEEFQYSPLLRP